MIRGSEGMAVQFAKCCKPIPGDPIIGMISKGQGMMIHTHDCPVIARTRPDPDRMLDVQWDPDTRKAFEVNIKLVVANQRGVLAKVAAEISSAGSNIQNVAVDPEDGGTYTGNALHAAGLQSPASRPDHARPAARPRSDPHLTRAGWVRVALAFDYRPRQP